MCHSLRTTGGTRGRTDVSPTRRAPADPDARIGDAERDETVTLLGDAAAEGYLTPDELDTRLETALTARTQADLQPLRADLPPTGWRCVTAGPRPWPRDAPPGRHCDRASPPTSR